MEEKDKYVDLPESKYSTRLHDCENVYIFIYVKPSQYNHEVIYSNVSIELSEGPGFARSIMQLNSVSSADLEKIVTTLSQAAGRVKELEQVNKTLQNA